jgi:hypothetical protein
MANGKPCNETLEVIEECNRHSCGGKPVDCKLTDWHEWGACSKCGGIKKRFRHIKEHPSGGGDSCKEDALQEVGVCDSNCHAKKQYCAWEPWGPWGECSAKCGSAYRKRKRLLETSDHPGVEPAYLQEFENASISRVAQLHQRAQHLEETHLKELGLSFACGGLSLVVAFGALRLLRHSRDHAVAGWQRAPAFDEAEASRQPLFS